MRRPAPGRCQAARCGRALIDGTAAAMHLTGFSGFNPETRLSFPSAKARGAAAILPQPTDRESV